VQARPLLATTPPRFEGAIGDTVGKESNNLNLSELRALAVRDYLVGAGVVPTRITTRIAGESDLQVPTADNVRLRSNRVAIVTIR